MSNTKKLKIYFVENLTFGIWWSGLFPRLLKDRLTAQRLESHCYVIDGSRLGMMMARGAGSLLGIRVKPLHFHLADVKDEKGQLIRLRIAYEDLAEVQSEVIAEPQFRDWMKTESLPGRLSTYLAKSIAFISLWERGTLWRALCIIQVCAWKVQNEHPEGIPILLLERRPWMKAIIRYALREGVNVIPVYPSSQVRIRIRHLIAPLAKKVVLRVKFRREQGTSRFYMRHGKLVARSPESSQGPRIVVEYYGHLNLDHPECYSDLFFWQQSALPAKDLLMTFGTQQAPLDDKKWSELSEHGIAAMATQIQSVTTPAVPLFMDLASLGNHSRRFKPVARVKSVETAWLSMRVQDYHRLRNYWAGLFAQEQVKIYLSWYKYDASHCAIADALQSVGGVTAIYQRAFEDLPSAETTIAADIVFGFSPAVAEIERRSGSLIPYHVATGYLGDHRFSLLRESAHKLGDQLRRQGVQHILCYFDENSSEDSRWNTGHEFMRYNYAFLLEKVLQEPWLGLILKPKIPKTLRRRLGPVAEILKQAEATGRCLVYSDGTLRSSDPPAAVALASDVAIHGHLCGGTAGLESALAGVPTLLLDREGWPASSLYRLGMGRVVFTQWQALWEACVEQWRRPEGIPGFGDWSPLLDEFDPFRDGRAAERMGTYLQWLLDGFKAGLNRETVLADAAERYTLMWGKDKITHVSGKKRDAFPQGDSVLRDRVDTKVLSHGK